jgi:hypothetical protein
MLDVLQKDISCPVALVSGRTDTYSTVPLLDAASTLLDLCRLFNPAEIVRVEPAYDQPSRHWTLNKF